MEEQSMSSTTEISDTVGGPKEIESEPELESDSFTVRAKFVRFRLGDASHYGFEDASGKFWDFSGCNSQTFDFAQELDESEANESNQGWGSNKDLQGKWFLLTVVKEEQPAYIDGPMVIATIIQEAELIVE